MREDPAGLLNINKPSGITSFGMVRRIKRVLGVRKAGHCGTLDPLAEGVLLVVFGKATKLQGMCMASRKVYRTRFLLGVATDTGDISGTVRERKEVPCLSDAEIAAVLAAFAGEIEQVPPMYSAIKIGGERLYKLARAGKEVERPARKVHIHSLDLLSRTDDTLELRIDCSCGTYVRSLAEDIGKKLGCGATMQSLCREKVGDFAVAESIDGTAVEGMAPGELLARSCSIETIRERCAPPAQHGEQL